jgi:hypothetical protein
LYHIEQSPPRSVGHIFTDLRSRRNPGYWRFHKSYSFGLCNVRILYFASAYRVQAGGTKYFPLAEAAFEAVKNGDGARAAATANTERWQAKQGVGRSTGEFGQTAGHDSFDLDAVVDSIKRIPWTARPAAVAIGIGKKLMKIEKLARDGRPNPNHTIKSGASAISSSRLTTTRTPQFRPSESQPSR